MSEEIFCGENFKRDVSGCVNHKPSIYFLVTSICFDLSSFLYI